MAAAVPDGPAAPQGLQHPGCARGLRATAPGRDAGSKPGRVVGMGGQGSTRSRHCTGMVRVVYGERPHQGSVPEGHLHGVQLPWC